MNKEFLYQPKPNCLSERTILITGASQGMGRAAAKCFAAHGATVILLARSIQKLETLYDEIEAQYAPPSIYPFNLATAAPGDYQALKENIEKHYGKLDGILHNAAFLGHLTPLEHTSIEQWYQVLQVNLNSAFLLSQATLPLLKQAKDASIIFTSADVGERARAYWGAYAVSKFGCNGLMQILADELQTNTHVRVNSIQLPKMRTALRASAYPAEDPSDLPPPEALLSVYLYLMGPDSQGVTGQIWNATVD